VGESEVPRNAQGLTKKTAVKKHQSGRQTEITDNAPDEQDHGELRLTAEGFNDTG